MTSKLHSVFSDKLVEVTKEKDELRELVKALLRENEELREDNCKLRRLMQQTGEIRSEISGAI